MLCSTFKGKCLHNIPSSADAVDITQIFPLILQALLQYIAGLDIPGAVLIFLPGWNLIFAIHKFLTQHPVFGKTRGFYCFRSFLPMRQWIEKGTCL
jgi:hypothetical protein